MRELEEIFDNKSDVGIAKAVIKMGNRARLAGKEQAVSELTSRAREFGLPQDTTRERYETVIAGLKIEEWIDLKDSEGCPLIETTNDGKYLFKNIYGTLWEP